MCREDITVAICAPEKHPYLSFTCGRLHLVAGNRKVCKDASGQCICFFGSCGIMEKTTSTAGIDLAEVKKARCAECTAREDNVGDRRSSQQLVESPLLVRKPITSPTDMKEFKGALETLWKGEKTCPFHAAVEDDKDEAEPSIEKKKRNAFDDSDAFQCTPVPSPAKSVVTSTVTVTPPRDADNKLPDSPTHGLKLGVGLSASRWANVEPAISITNRASPVPQPTCPTPQRKYNGHTTHRGGARAVIKLAQIKSAKDFLSRGN